MHSYCGGSGVNYDFKVADIVCSKEYIEGYYVVGQPMIEKEPQRLFDGLGIILEDVDKSTSDPTCLVMLNTGKIIRIKEERLVTVIRNDIDKVAI